MELIVLGSSSKGNCYLFKAGSKAKEECLVLEAGIPFTAVKKALNFNLNSVVGVLCSHRHGDHAKYLHKFAETGITCYANADVIESMPDSAKPLCKEIKSMHGYKVGGYKVFVLPMNHDVPCHGFVIEHAEMGRVFFATDTFAIKYRVADINYYMIEANYNDEVLDENIASGKTHGVMRDRLLQSHMEASMTATFLTKCDLKRTKQVMLLHLSENNSDEKMCVRKVERATGKPTYVLHAGDEISL
ncbi:MAG: MBL fold metallo-hydrolase [Paludibacteraceae bacterium]|nr:MBL fold metallo-hydrolase [Paludibacteraceae bacterium]